MRMPAGLLLVTLALSLLPGKALAAWSHDPNVGLMVAPPGVFQAYPSADADGSGGLFVTWQDQRAGGSNVDIYAQHMTADGSVSPGWPATGLPVCTATGNQNYPALVTDGAGGCWIAWEDSRTSASDRDIYVQHVLANGSLAPGFAANGVRLNTLVGKDETGVRLAADGLGGVYAAWSFAYLAPTDYDVYGAHLNAAGTVQFVGGLDMSGNLQQSPTLIADGSGNAIVSYANNDNAGSIGAWQIRFFKFGPTGTHLTTTLTISSPVPMNASPTQLVTDNAGGAYVTFVTFTGSNPQYYVARVGSAGTFVWTPTILAPFDGTVGMSHLVTCSDGAGGLLAAWNDNRYATNWGCYALRLLPGGFHATGWPGTGLPVCPSTVAPLAEDIVPDGTGGAIVGWTDTRNTAGEYYATRMTGAGLAVPGWSATGTPIATGGDAAPGNLGLVPDGKGGALAAFSFSRSNTFEIYAQNLDAFGQLGDDRPVLGKPADVRNDQGGKVRLQWNASWLDQPASLGIAQYWVWRQTPVTAAQAAVQRGAGLWEAGASATAPAAGTRLFRPAGTAGALYAWEYLAALGTNGSSQYSYVAATATDSMTGHNPYTTFMVEARGAAVGTFWQSAPDSGYSVDNIPPLPPAPFAGTYSAGTATLHWGVNLEADLAGYRLYRGATSSFVPSPGNLVAAKSDTGYVDAAGQAYFYKLSAVDVHGNESAFAALTPSGVLGVGPVAARELSLSAPMPNPARGTASVAYTLSRSGPARLSLYDASGRRVRVLADGVQDAGTYRVALELRDGSRGTLPAGLYWLRLEAEGRALTQRVLTLK